MVICPTGFRVFASESFRRWPLADPRHRLCAMAALWAIATAARADPIDDYMRRPIEVAHVPAAAVAVVRNGRIEKLAAYGVANLETDTKASPDSAFALA